MAKKKTKNKYFKIIYSLLIITPVVFLALTFFVQVKEEIKYQYGLITPEKEKLEVLNKDFSILIEKINAVAPITFNVNPFNKNEFLKVLKTSVAHAKGTNLPGEGGNVYLFAHSTDAFYNAGNYNAVFFLLGKLQKDDEIKIYYKEKEYIYTVQQIKVVGANDTKYLGRINDYGETLTLQTCYPPGTTLKRLIVIANLKN